MEIERSSFPALFRYPEIDFCRSSCYVFHADAEEAKDRPAHLTLQLWKRAISNTLSINELTAGSQDRAIIRNHIARSSGETRHREHRVERLGLAG